MRKEITLREVYQRQLKATKGNTYKALEDTIILLFPLCVVWDNETMEINIRILASKLEVKI